MNNELIVSTRSSEDTDFKNFINRQETIMNFPSDSSLAISKSISPYKTKTIVDYIESFVDSGDITIEKFEDNRYKIKTSIPSFNPKINVNITSSSIFTIESSGGVGSIECGDFDLSNVDIGDKIIFYDEANNNINLKNISLTITSIKDNKIFVEDPFGLMMFSGEIEDALGFSVYKPEILDSYIIKLNGDITPANHGLYAIDSATDRFIIIKSDKELIETTVTATRPSIKIFSKTINFVSVEVTADCTLLIDDKEIEIASFGKGIFTSTLQASSIAIKNTSNTIFNVTVIFGTSNLDTDNLSIC